MYNELHLYVGECSFCRKRIISQWSPQNGRRICCPSCWNCDRWDGMLHGRDIDFSRSFFKQLRALRDASPEMSVNVGPSMENSEYVHCANHLKNCYLLMHADFCEDCYYGYGFKKNTACVDGFYNFGCELCYDCVDCHRCYDLRGSQECINCSSSAFLRDCQGCKRCVCCVGLREKEFCFENEQLSQEEYGTRLRSCDLGSFAFYQRMSKRRRELELHHPFKEFQGYAVENCSGNHLYNYKNVHNSFDCEDTEDAKYCYQVVTGARSLYDVYQWGLNIEMCYECSHVGDQSYRILFSTQTHLSAHDILYSCWMQGCSSCFGCIGLKRKSFCILNKQYTEEEYHSLVPQLIAHMQKTGEWGEFFPLGFSPFGYNKTVAQLYYPLTREEVHTQGLQWDDYELPAPSVERVFGTEDLPDNIADVSDDILNAAIECEVTKRPFKVTAQELKFYRLQCIPLPRRSWLQRHLDRFHQRNPRKLWKRPCMKCGKDIQTSYAPDRHEVVYCESCYHKEVY